MLLLKSIGNEINKREIDYAKNNENDVQYGLGRNDNLRNVCAGLASYLRGI